MNLLKKASLATLTFFGMSFAAGSLWSPDIVAFPSLQVQNDNVKDCWEENPPDEEYQSVCYDNAGGWWFGYTNSQTFGGVEDVQVYLSDEWQAFDDVSLTDPDPEIGSLIGPSLKVKVDVEVLSGNGAGIGFNHKQESNRWDGSASNLVDITSKGGYCLTYSLSGDPMQFVLGWDESLADDPAYDVWYATLQPGTNTTLDLPWNKFIQGGWATGKYDITRAQEEAVSVKIRNDGGGNSEFELFELGWAGECTGGTPIQNVAKSVVSPFSLNGRMLSTSKATSAQVINMQGAVVASLENGNQLDLSNVPTGIYLVRAAKLGISQKIVIK